MLLLQTERLILVIIDIYTYIIIINAVLSWLIAFGVVNTYNRLVSSIIEATHRLTEPALRPIRRVLPDLGGLDISPVLLILFLQYILKALVIDLFSLL